jgi:diguanylate cyclase (GGDEF)-like protein
MIFINNAKSYAKNIQKELKREIKVCPHRELKRDKKLHEKMEDMLSIILNDTVKYVFVLHRDRHGNYRYLLDGSKEKAHFNQRLSVDKKMWNRVYDGQKPLIVEQELDSLWVTYLEPVIYNGKTEAIIAIDFSTTLPTNISNAIEPLNKVFIYIFTAIGLLVSILIYQSIVGIRIKKDSITDTLTQVYNRNYLRDFLNNIDIEKYQIMMLDIDHFKQVNDNYGHKAGDLVLSQMAEVIKGEIRGEDVLVRFGGEEFILFIKKSLKKPELAYDVAERIRMKVEKLTFNYEDTAINITLSIGISCQPEHFKSVTLAIKHADEMLYIAKKEGRNKVVVTSVVEKEISPTVEQKSINDVKEALDEGRILCYYQAIYNIEKTKIIKYEALVRLKEKSGKIVSPYFFLENIMYTNIYNELTKFVLSDVFKKIKEINKEMSVNLNFSDILDNKIFSLIIEEIEKNRDLSSWLVIELLEYEYLQEVTVIQERLLEIKEYGVKIAIDDFGSGYSNYSIFKLLPIDILKIDGSIIKDIDSSEISYKITKSIVLLAKELGITTVAEFVHSESVYDVVKSLDVDEIQGYFLAEPKADIEKI